MHFPKKNTTSNIINMKDCIVLYMYCLLFNHAKTYKWIWMKFVIHTKRLALRLTRWIYKINEIANINCVPRSVGVVSVMPNLKYNCSSIHSSLFLRAVR